MSERIKRTFSIRPRTSARIDEIADLTRRTYSAVIEIAIDRLVIEKDFEQADAHSVNPNFRFDPDSAE